MSTSHVKYVIVGGGGAGSAAAAEIRRHDARGSVLLIGQEHSRPYVRPMLSKQFLRRETDRMKIAIDPVGWYAERDIEMRTSRRVSHLDTARQTITIDNGEEIAFDKLLLATGAAPKPLRVPGADLPNIFYMRTIEDTDRIHHAIEKAKTDGRAQAAQNDPAKVARGRIVVIGGGLLAVELAASLRQMNLHIDLVMPTHAWGKIAGENVGRFMGKYLESLGVVIHPDSPVDHFEGDGRVQRVVTARGLTIDCDFVIAAQGIIPNRDLLRNTPIAAEKAILVDDHCRTSAPNIFAAGDCAAVLDPLFGKHRIIDHWASARLLGTIAGANMAGIERRYESVNAFWSDVGALTLNAWGEPRFVDRRLLRGMPTVESPECVEIGVAPDGRVAQVLAIGHNREHAVFESLVARRFNVQGHEEAMKDPAVSLAGLLK